MGADSSKASHAGGGHAGEDTGVSLWEGVPEPVLWLVQAQVRLLLTNHSSALLHRPESAGPSGDESPRAEMTRGGDLEPHEAALAHAALRDRALAPRLQRVLDRLVPAHLSETVFWDNFFSHVDVLKVRVVTDFLTAQDAVIAERAQKHRNWVQLFDAMEPDMRVDLRRAAERIAARQQQPACSELELQLGLDQHRPPRWQPDAEAWLEYVEDGPHEVTKVLRHALEDRGESEAAVGAPREEPPIPRLWASPDDAAAVQGARTTSMDPSMDPSSEPSRTSAPSTAAVPTKIMPPPPPPPLAGEPPLTTPTDTVASVLRADEDEDEVL